jgi:hypothetical protein
MINGDAKNTEALAPHGSHLRAFARADTEKALAPHGSHLRAFARGLSGA